MNTMLRGRIVDDGRRRKRHFLVGFGLLVLAASLVGAWYALPHPGNDNGMELRTSAQVPGKFELIPFPTPRPVANVAFQDGAGRSLTLADFKGKVVLLNVWATWCSPCRKEMPTLDRLQAQRGGKDFEVVALSIDREGPDVVRKFFAETGIRNLALYIDPSMDAQSKLEVIGVPTTLLIDRDGREVARHTGIAEWDRPEVIDTIARYTGKRMTKGLAVEPAPLDRGRRAATRWR